MTAIAGLFFAALTLLMHFMHNPLQIGALILTVILAWKTADDGETNYFEGTSTSYFLSVMPSSRHFIRSFNG